MTTSLPPPPEAELIRERREAQVPRLSMREAARRAGLSAPWWRMLETGVRRVKGQDFPERANAETLARMAQTVGVTGAELTAAGRADAAAILEKLPTNPHLQLSIDVRNSRDLTERQKRALLELINRNGK